MVKGIETEVDLISQLNLATTTEPKTLTVTLPETQKEESEDIEEIEPGTNDDFHESAELEPEEDEEIIPTDRSKRQAKRMLSAFNTISRLLLKPLYKMKILKPGDEEYSKSFSALSDSDKGSYKDMPEADSEDFKRLQRYDYFLKLSAKIKLDEEEEEEGIEILSELVQKNKSLQMSPEASLALWGFGIVIARVEPVLPDFGSKLFNNSSDDETKGEFQHSTSGQEENRKVHGDTETS